MQLRIKTNLLISWSHGYERLSVLKLPALESKSLHKIRIVFTRCLPVMQGWSLSLHLEIAGQIAGYINS